jgi:hypothetical protein
VNAKAWVVPLTAAVIGLLYLATGIAGGDAFLAIAGPVLMVAFAALLLGVRRRSETVQGLLDRRDERINALDLRATAVTGIVLVGAVLVGFTVSVARGGDGSPYVWLGCLAGVTYVAAFVAMRVRG